MAARDIMPWRSAGGGPGSTVKVETYPLHPARTYHEGEVLVLTEAQGQLAVALINPDVSNHTDAGAAGVAGAIGIAAEPAQGMASSGTGATNPEWQDRGVWIFTSDQEFVTQNYTDEVVANAWSNSALHAVVGDECGLAVRADATWGISVNGEVTVQQFRITQVLNAARQPIKDAATVATFVVFRLQTAHQPGIVPQ